MNLPSSNTQYPQYRKTRYLLAVTLCVSGSVPGLLLRGDTSEESPCQDETLRWIFAATYFEWSTRSAHLHLRCAPSQVQV